MKVKKKRKVWKTPEIHTNITFSHNFFTACPNVIFEESACQNSNRLLTTSFKMALQKNKIKVSHTKINHIFPRNKNGSTEPHNYPINLIFSVNKNLVCSGV